MSTILKALRRLEQEKTSTGRPLREQVTGGGGGGDGGGPGPTRRRWPILVGGVAAGVAAGLGVLFLTLRRDAGAPEATPEAPAPGAAVAVATAEPAARAPGRKRIAPIAPKGRRQPAADVEDVAVVPRAPAAPRIAQGDPAVGAATEDALAAGALPPDARPGSAPPPSPAAAAAQRAAAQQRAASSQREAMARRAEEAKRRAEERRAEAQAPVPGRIHAGQRAPRPTPAPVVASAQAPVAPAPVAPAPAPVAPAPAPPAVAAVPAPVAPAPAPVAPAPDAAPPAREPAPRAPVTAKAPAPGAATPASAKAPAPTPVAKAAAPKPAPKDPLPPLVVARTLWHPIAERRVAVIELPGHDPAEFKEGAEVLPGTRIALIEPSGVVFRFDGRDVRKKVGSP